MTTSSPIAPVERAAQYLKEAHLAVVMTGAGISTPSGIPDFRSPGSGLWAQADPMEVISLTTFRRRPQVFFDWFRPLARQIEHAEPNPAHLGLARLEQAGLIKAVITQNIDELHQRAGAQRVLELHGSARTLTCQGCGKHYPAEDFLEAYLDGGALPHCGACQALLKPDIVFFEETLPEEVWAAAMDLTESCDLFFVIGSSLNVQPAAQLPMRAAERGARILINNREETYLNRYADVVMREDVAEAIPELCKLCL
jgi:NAD-dependent deacetylase